MSVLDCLRRMSWVAVAAAAAGCGGITLPEPGGEPDPFDFRTLAGPSLELPEPGAPAEQAAPSRTERSIAAAEQEVNVEYIQELIKKLADELNGPVQAPLPDGDTAKAAAATDAEDMIERSVEALETTARGMRTPPAAETARPAAPVSSWWPTGGSGMVGTCCSRLFFFAVFAFTRTAV